MNLEKLNLTELSREEMVSIEGGSWIGRVWKWIKSHFTAEIVDTPKGPGVVGGVSVDF